MTDPPATAITYILDAGDLAYHQGIPHDAFELLIDADQPTAVVALLRSARRITIENGITDDEFREALRSAWHFAEMVAEDEAAEAK